VVTSNVPQISIPSAPPEKVEASDVLFLMQKGGYTFRIAEAVYELGIVANFFAIRAKGLFPCILHQGEAEQPMREKRVILDNSRPDFSNVCHKISFLLFVGVLPYNPHTGEAWGLKQGVKYTNPRF
jgi:hypothetical protein